MHSQTVMPVATEPPQHDIDIRQWTVSLSVCGIILVLSRYVFDPEAMNRKFKLKKERCACVQCEELIVHLKNKEMKRKYSLWIH